MTTVPKKSSVRAARSSQRAVPTAPVAVELALAQSHEVKAKIEAYADDLAVANDAVKIKIADGATSLPAPQALKQSLAIETQVQEFAEDLQDVTSTLSQGVDELKQIAAALETSREALAESEAALALSRQEEALATTRALHDSLTRLPNRGLFNDRLAQALSMAERHDWNLAVMFLDLDQFKRINDTHGHAAGDSVLKAVAERLLANCRHEDTVCRNGGDEFLYLLVNPRVRANVERVTTTVLAAIAQPIEVNAQLSLVTRPSIGIALYPEHGRTAEQLIARADAAMYGAKKGAGGWLFYDSLDGAAPAS